VNRLERRFPETHLVIYPVQVQGDLAKHDIRRALEAFNEFGEVDVLILARGGGSIEDLWAFNEEIVVRAIAASRIPVISAIGHEVDYTISDFVADLRAPTPSAAAEMVLPEKRELVGQLSDLRKRLKQALRGELEVLKERLRNTVESRPLTQPQLLLDERWQTLDDRTKRLRLNLARMLELKKHQLKAVVGKLDALSPLACLVRGYSIVFDDRHQTIIKSTVDLARGQRVLVRLSDGEFLSQVLDISKSKLNR